MLKEIEVGSSIIDTPMTYTVDGVQYVAVQAGWGGGGWFAPHPTSAVIKYGNAGRIIAFKLDGGETPLPPEIDRNPEIPEPPAQFADPDTIARGARLFGSCRSCHANRPDGMTPDLRRVGSIGSAPAFKGVVMDGLLRTRGMPQWDDVLSEEDTEAIRAYLIDVAQSAYQAQQSGVDENEEVVPTDMAH